MLLNIAISFSLYRCRKEGKCNKGNEDLRTSEKYGAQRRMNYVYAVVRLKEDTVKGRLTHCGMERRQ
jgi:hypothetical protein